MWAAFRRRGATCHGGAEGEDGSSSYGGHCEVAPRMREPHDSEPGLRPGFSAAGRACGEPAEERGGRSRRRDRHHGSRYAADPAHKPASSVDAVRVPHRRRESAGDLA